MSGDAISSKGVAMYLTKGAAEPTVVEPTAITKAAPAVISAVAPGAAVGQLVRVNNSGFTSLDGKLFSVSAVDAGAGTFTLLGSDTTDEPGAMSDDAEVEMWDATDLVRLCLTSFTFNPETPGTTSVGTYCNPSATLPAVATSAGTATLGGWIDKDDAGYKELVLAAKDAAQRIFSIVLPQAQGEIVAPISFSNIAWDIPLDGGMAFTANGALGSAPVHLF